MKIKEILKTMLIFLCIILIICFLSVAIFSVAKVEQFTPKAIAKQIVSSFLYLIGYDDLFSNSWIMKCFLAIVGLMAVSVLSAYLTVLFLYRTDVKICPNIFIWQDIDGNYYCTIFIKNTGKTVCNLRMSIDLYSETGNKEDRKEIVIDHCERQKPILPKQSPWRENFLISATEEPFFYQAFQHLINEEKCTLYVLWSFVDGTTGQETIHIQPYTLDSCVFGEFDTPSWKFEKEYEFKYEMKKCFTEWITSNVHYIPLKRAIPINASALRLQYQRECDEQIDPSVVQLEHQRLPATQREKLTMVVDYSKVNLSSLDPEFFVMASIQFMTPQDWRVFFDKEWLFQFEMFGDEDKIEKITVEIKKRERLEKVIYGEFEVVEDLNSEEAQNCISLHREGVSREDFKEIKEVDFTIFLKHMKNQNCPAGTVTIINPILCDKTEIYMKKCDNQSLESMEGNELVTV